MIDDGFKHHVIANSSISWWGAWLGKKPNKITVVPTNWFSDVNHSNPDIYCDDWIKINK